MKICLEHRECDENLSAKTTIMNASEHIHILFMTMKNTLASNVRCSFELEVIKYFTTDSDRADSPISFIRSPIPIPQVSIHLTRILPPVPISSFKPHPTYDVFRNVFHALLLSPCNSFKLRSMCVLRLRMYVRCCDLSGVLHPICLRNRFRRNMHGGQLPIWKHGL